MLDLDESLRYTYADYLTWLDDKRRELINGFIHLMSAPMRRHTRVSTKLVRHIDSFIEYWIVDPKTKTACAFLLQPDRKYDLGTVYDNTQKAPVHLLEGLEIDLSDLFED